MKNLLFPLLFSFVFSFYAIGQQCAENTTLDGSISVNYSEDQDASSGCGQSFTACLTGSLDAITVRSHVTSSSGNVTLSIGTGTPITPSNIQTYTVTLPSGIGEKTINIPSYNMISGNIYFFQILGIQSQPLQAFSVGEFGNYENGEVYFKSPGSPWQESLFGTVDMYFKTTGSAFPLPVELISFTSSIYGQNILLHWRTASENNNSGFYLQRSTDGKNWNDLAFVPGIGTTYELKTYSYTDEHPMPGLSYYRLKQVDYDGAVEYSKIISVEMKGEGSGISLFPNPATSTATLMFQSDYWGEASLYLFDLTGRLMKTEIFSKGDNYFRKEFGLEGMPAGAYLIKVVAGNEQWQQRLVVE